MARLLVIAAVVVLAGTAQAADRPAHTRIPVSPAAAQRAATGAFNHRLTERDIENRLIGEGYRIDHIDRRGDSYFVRAFLGDDVYSGYIGRDDGRWIKRVWMGLYNDGDYWSRADRGGH
jgi:hypothetical protein